MELNRKCEYQSNILDSKNLVNYTEFTNKRIIKLDGIGDKLDKEKHMSLKEHLKSEIQGEMKKEI